MSQAAVAVVEDEPDLLESVIEFLEGRGLRAFPAADGEALRALCAGERLDVVVLDVNLPGEDGFALTRWLRMANPGVGIIFATASHRPNERAFALEIGADDYLVKPYELRELLARIRTLTRRLPQEAGARTVAPAPATRRTVPVGGHTLDLDNRRLTRSDGGEVELTSGEFDLLEAFVRRPHRTLSRTQLLGFSGGDTERSIDIRITRLRRKIEREPAKPTLIRTVHGEGYAFVPSP